jgi:hypothetical protein
MKSAREHHCGHCHKPQRETGPLHFAPLLHAGLPLGICAACAMDALLHLWSLGALNGVPPAIPTPPEPGEPA